MASAKLGVGVIGCGTVGGGVVKLLVAEQAQLRRKTGVTVELRKAVDTDAAKRSATGLPPALLAEDANAVLADPEIGVVVEVIGGVNPARSLVEGALAAGKHVVTANKELVAKHGPELLALARKHGVTLHFEASSCGGIPVIHALGQSLAANRFETLLGIVNGTTNFILTKMHREGAEFAEVLAEAQRLGYAEADPTADVDGHDAAYKLAILAAMAFDSHFDYRDIHTEGIRNISARDIAIAKDYGYVVKLLAIGAAHADGRVELRVHPVLVPEEHPLAAVSDAFNAVFARGNYVGDVMLYGRGAGQLPTASAIVGDIIDLAMHQAQGGTSPRMNFGTQAKAVVPMGEVRTQYYLRLDVKDRPGVLAAIARIFGDCGVSISAVKQAAATTESVELVIFTHEVGEAAFQKAVAGIGKLDVVVGVRAIIRAHV
ncbi:MAG: homoserine dehydrogenase [Deltaproteobacteria bacterium]|nr:homoserine dehydrogenase [Deltaproteobacteria bacterium]